MKCKIAVIENNIIATNTIRSSLMEALRAHGHEVILLTGGTKNELVRAQNKGFGIFNVESSSQNPVSVFRYMRNIKLALRKSQATLCLTFTIRPAIWGNIVASSLKIPTITNITGIGPLLTKNSLTYFIARLLYKFVLRRTEKIFFQNNDDMRIFIDKGYAKPEVSERIPGSGVDSDFYSPRTLTVHKNNKKFKFLFVSRLVIDKGIIEYVNAARVLKSQLNAEFQILGPLWVQNLKKNTISAEILKSWQSENTITYLGDTNDVRNFMCDADCIVLPSYREGMSNVLLEASSMARPCISTFTTGCQDIIEDGRTGYLCRVRDVEDLINKMRKMYHLPLPLREKMGKRGREKVIQEFSKKFVIDAYLKAISGILEKKVDE